MAERSKALVLDTSLFGGVGSNPTAASYFLLAYSVQEIQQGRRKTSPTKLDSQSLLRMLGKAQVKSFNVLKRCGDDILEPKPY